MACNDYNSCCYLLYDPTWTKKNEKKERKEKIQKIEKILEENHKNTLVRRIY